MSEHDFEALKIENQLCFPLYACSREVIKQYKPFLDELDLTYTQYIAMMVLWENQEMTVKELGDVLYLDSGTLTPLLKKLEAKNYVTRTRSRKDERNLIVALTEQGEQLKEQAMKMPRAIADYTELSKKEAEDLYRTLYKILARLEQCKN
ncbi:MAG: MarR family transcriptional regulator [Oscillospiraceae bacterium]|nr:MarR family transcriptional regulator [Oscillospiraceae bacterium]